MKEVERPAPVLMAARNHDCNGFIDAAVGFESRISQIIESAQDIVMPMRRVREAQPSFIEDFAGSKRAEHTTVEQIVFGSLAGLGDGRRFASCAFVFEQSFEHADGGMEGRAPAFGCFAVPAAIFELLAQELLSQCVVRFLEIRARAEDSAIDAGLRFAVKKWPVVERLKHEPLVDTVDHLARLPACGVETEILQDDETPEGNEIPLPAAPTAVRRLLCEKLGSPTFGCDARSLGCNRVGSFIGEVSHDLPTDGWVGIEEPFEVRGPGRVIL